MELEREHVETKLRRMMQAQLGLITRTQAIEAGLTEAGIRYRARIGRWQRLFPGIFLAAGVEASWEQRLLAAQLWLGDECVVSHRAAV